MVYNPYSTKPIPIDTHDVFFHYKRYVLSVLNKLGYKNVHVYFEHVTLSADWVYYPMLDNTVLINVVLNFHSQNEFEKYDYNSPLKVYIFEDSAQFFDLQIHEVKYFLSRKHTIYNNTTSKYIKQ